MSAGGVTISAMRPDMLADLRQPSAPTAGAVVGPSGEETMRSSMLRVVAVIRWRLNGERTLDGTERLVVIARHQVAVDR
jgi:hypothetical protein